MFEDTTGAVGSRNKIIFNIMHNIFNIRDTEVVIYIIPILSKRTNGLNHDTNKR